MMKLTDGYYLSIYSCVNKYLNGYGDSMRHDHNMALWEKKGECVKLIHHWEFERITGKKHHRISFYDKGSAVKFINDCLNEYGLTIDDMVHIIGTPELSTEQYYNKDIGEEYTYHAIAHIFSSMMMDTDIFYKEDILSLSLDGGADCLIDNENYGKRYDFLCAFSSQGKIRYMPIPSPGRYWIELYKKTGLEEGTLMALATATKCKTIEKIYNDNEIVEIYRIYKDNHEMLIDKIVQRINSYTMDDVGVKFDYYDEHFTEQENKISMMAKVIQEISLKLLDKIIARCVNEFQFKPSEVCISLSGGYALNCPTNTYLMHKYRFKKQLIAPCVNDSGQAIGMGLYHFYKNQGAINFHLEHPYYGNCDRDIEVLNKRQYACHIESVEETLDKFVEDLLSEPIIWFDGRAEIGPRALGHRSILANPMKMSSKDLLNQYKLRQWWRPVAPIILADELENWFDNSFESPYMLNNFIVKKDKRDKVPAITHMDYTARVQTIDENMNPRLCKCIKNFYDVTKVPIICNTSLNDRGEPIINTIEEALNFALRKGIRIMYINGQRVVLKNHEGFKETKPKSRQADLFISDANKVDLCMSLYEYEAYFATPQLQMFDLEKEEDIAMIKAILKKVKKVNYHAQ